MNKTEINFTKEFNKMLPACENGFMRLSFSKNYLTAMRLFCTLKEAEAASYLMSYEVVRETEESFTIELEFAWSFGLLNSAFRFGHDWHEYLVNSK